MPKNIKDPKSMPTPFMSSIGIIDYPGFVLFSQICKEKIRKDRCILVKDFYGWEQSALVNVVRHIAVPSFLLLHWAPNQVSDLPFKILTALSYERNFDWEAKEEKSSTCELAVGRRKDQYFECFL